MKRLTSVVTDILAELALLFLSSWVVMLVLGAAHSNDGRVPDFSYVTTLLVLIAARWACMSASHNEGRDK